MIRRDVNKEILESYYNLLNGKIVYDGSEVYVGTRIPRNETNYILLYIEDITKDTVTDDTAIYDVIVALEVTSIQEQMGGDDGPVNDIMDQVLSIIDDPDSLIMTNFNCPLTQYGDMDGDSDQTETNFILTKTIRMLNKIEQIK
ncbi:MAG: hypothetical protein U9R01_01350 [candidate division WOR-3 bacterium]|nr:hypothetical protein [candidate division WOR-3 bacterium]